MEGGGDLRFDQVRALIRIIAEANEIPCHDPSRLTHLLGGVRRIIGATVGGFVTDCDFHPSGRGAHTAGVLDGWDGTTLSVLEVLASEGSNFSPGIAAMMRTCPSTSGATLAATGEQLVGRDGWYRSPYVDSYLLRANLDHALYSCTRGAAPSVVHGLGFHREKGGQPFSASDRALVHLFQLECLKFFEPAACDIDDVLRARLPARAQEALRHLLEGLADKEIADAMGISRYTVNEYTKAIYRHFGVHSRAALIAKFRRIPANPSF